MTQELKKIDYRFKLLYAIGILFVVAGHCDNPIPILTQWFPYYSFHLALFVFASGYFYKPENEKGIIDYIWRKIKILIIPLYLYNFFYAIFVHFTHTLGFTIGGEVSFYNLIVEPWFGGHQFVYNMGGWFIAPLFCLETINILLRVILGKTDIGKYKYFETIYYLLFVLIGLLGIQCAIFSYKPHLVLFYRTAYFLPFFGLGRLYKVYLEKYDNRIPSIWYFFIIFVIQICIAYNYGRVPAYIPSWCHNFDHSFMPILVGYTGIAFWFRVAKILTPALGTNKYINLMADSTYSIMINQFLGFFLVKLFFAMIYSASFDFIAFKTSIWWYYYPNGVRLLGIIYLVAGIIVPIYMQKFVTCANNFFRRKLRCKF